MVEYREIRLGDYIKDIASGPFGSNLKVECFVPFGFPIIDGANLMGTRVTDNITKYVTEEKARSLARSIAKRHDVIVTISGTLGQISYIPLNSKFSEYLCSQRQFRVTFDEKSIDVEYLVYYFHTKQGQKKILSFANYVGVPALAQPLPNFKDITINIPPIDYQNKISSFIGFINDKIALNTRMNADLEAMAKKLYDYWFVQFDFPDENGNPYKSSGGKMVYNSTLKREIPAGWEVKTLNDLVETPKESITPFENPDKEYKHYSIPAFDTCGSYLLEKGRDIQSNKFVVHKGQILAPKLNPWYNRIIMVNNSDDAICSTEYVVLDAIEEYTKGFLFFVLKTDSFISYCTKGSSGTSHSQRRVPPEILKGFSIPFNKTIVSMYTDFVKYQIDKLNGNQEQTRHLTHLRDSLLPMLMNGQVTVE